MSKRVKARLAKYGGSAAFVGLMAWLYISLRDFDGAKLVDKYRMLSDAFAVPGMLLLMFGCLIWISNLGALDGLAYAVSFAFRSLIPGGRYKDEKYADYVERKRENRVKGYGFLFASGGVTMAISIVFMVLFYSLY